MIQPKSKIVFITFLNDFSGSPNVLSVVAKQFIQKNYNVEIITNKSEGFLSNIIGAKYSFVHYKWSDKSLWVLFYWIFVQIELFFKIFIRSGKNTIFYINTITPIGACWACKITGKKMVYHVHENMQQNKFFYKIYCWTYKYCNSKTIFVSKYLESLSVNCRQGRVIYNSLDPVFSDTAKKNLLTNNLKKDTILIVASLRRFKGVYEFVELAKRLPEYQFEMVLNASEQEVRDFRVETNASQNIEMHAVQKKLHPFYQRAKLLLSLSHPDEWVETFGLTILEAMVYGIPSIVPNVGGPVELVENGVNGFSIDPMDGALLVEKVKLLMSDDKIHMNFSAKALEKSTHFGVERMITDIEKYITQ